MSQSHPKCKLKSRADDIPKHKKGEKTWVCETCGMLTIAVRKPPCGADRLLDALMGVMHEKNRLHIED